MSVSGVKPCVGAVDGIIGSPYEDADSTAYLAMCRQPITVLEGDSAVLASSLRRARDRLNLVGVGVYGAGSVVDKALKSARLHR